MKFKLLFVFAILSLNLHAQEEVEYLPYGTMDSWTVRYIKESFLLGGKTRALYVIAETDTIRKNKPYPYGENGSPWGTSNAYAKVVGVEKVAVSVTPEQRGDGYCCRLETTLQTVTASERITQSILTWQNDHKLPVRYGDITQSPDYKIWEKLSKDRFMARNSKGKMVPIQEIGYKADVEPTHLILQISAGCQEPFVGCPGNVVWCDNIRLVY